MIEKKILSLAASITKLLIINLFLLQSNLYATEKKYEENEEGILSLMYHRFEENEYPSTNVKMEVFKKHIEIIKKNNYDFFDPKDFEKKFYEVKLNKTILITIDDAFLSFYQNAWPYLKQNKIPFILFTSTEFIGKKGYMNIDQLKEVESESFAYLGNHSHSHGYMVEFDKKSFINFGTAQDHKKVYEKEKGPNTGGMGAYSPAPVVTAEVHKRIMQEVIEPTISGMAAEGNNQGGKGKKGGKGAGKKGKV